MSGDLLFEDDSIVGFLEIAESVAKVLTTWRQSEVRFLSSLAERLRSANSKAWNVYSVFLIVSTPTEAERGELLAIEEDLTSSRKIARGGVGTREALIRALYPVLPIQARAVLGTQTLKDRLRSRITGRVPENALNLLLGGRSEDFDPETVIPLLSEDQ